jgi:electron transfer flavoprotein alpha subunit
MSTDNICVFIQQDDGKIAEVSLELVSKAKELAGELSTRSEGKKKVKVQGILIGDGIKNKAEEIISYGADEVFCVENKRLKHYTPIPYQKVMEEILRKHSPQIVLFGATTTGRDLGPRIASALKVGLTADCTDLRIGDHKIEDKVFTDILFQIRPAFGGNIIATIVSPEHKPQMATVREGVMKLNDPDPSLKGKVTMVEVKLDDGDFLTEIIKQVKGGKSVNLKASQIIVAGGMGVGTTENFKLIEEFAHVIGADVGASRAAVDAGFISKDHQVGQTGTTVRPKLYIACGISGAIQHRAGMDESGRIIAINDDPEAPIFQIAHYGIVGNLNEIIPQFIKSYKEKV